MKKKYEVGDRVKVNNDVLIVSGKIGTIVYIINDIALLRIPGLKGHDGYGANGCPKQNNHENWWVYTNQIRNISFNKLK